MKDDFNRPGNRNCWKIQPQVHLMWGLQQAVPPIADINVLSDINNKITADTLKEVWDFIQKNHRGREVTAISALPDTQIITLHCTATLAEDLQKKFGGQLYSNPKIAPFGPPQP